MEEQDQAVKEIDVLPDICNMCTFQSCKQLEAQNNLVFILVIILAN